MPVTNRPPSQAHADGERSHAALAIPAGAASRSHAYLSSRLVTREGSMGVFKSPDPGFAPPGFTPDKR